MTLLKIVEDFSYSAIGTMWVSPFVKGKPSGNRWAVFPCLFCCQKPICWHFLLTKPNFDDFGQNSFLRKKFGICQQTKKNTANQTVYGVIFCGGDKRDRTADLLNAIYNTPIFYRLISFWKVLYLQRFFRCFLIFMGYRLISWNMFVDTFCWQKCWQLSKHGG